MTRRATKPETSASCARWRPAKARLAGLAQAARAQYTRYADDLAFSGGERFRRGIPGFVAAVAAICEEYDRLKAILTNCIRRGPTKENGERHPDFHAHLAGRVSFFESVHAARGARLRAMLNQIDWGEEAK